MSRGGRFLPSPALVVACCALFVALGGTGYAAFKLPRNSVGSINVKDRSLLARDLAPGVIRPGPPGPAGPPGASAVKWALFLKDGTIASRNGDIRLVTRPTAGSYIVDVGGAARGKAILVTPSLGGADLVARGSASASPCGGPPEGITCPSSDDANHVWVFTSSTAGAPEPHAFYLAVIG